MKNFNKRIEELAENYCNKSKDYGDFHSFIAGANAAKELMQEKLNVAVEALEWYNRAYKKYVYAREIGTEFSENALNKIRGENE